MYEFEYIVELERDKNKISGNITKLKSGKILKENDTIHEKINLFFSKKLEKLQEIDYNKADLFLYSEDINEIPNIVVKDKSVFNPLAALCDLRNLRPKDKDLKDDKSVIDTSIKSESAFGITFKIDKSTDRTYFLLADYINNMISNNNLISIKDLEKLKLYFDLKLDYTIIYKELTCSKVNNKNNIKYRYVPLNYYCKFDELDLKKIDKLSHKYIYSCYTIADVIFAVLHFLVLHGYNDIKKCENCDKYFFSTKVSREKYCEREKTNCRKMIKKLKREIQTLNKSIYDNIYYNWSQYCDNGLDEEDENTEWLQFKKERNKYELMLKKDKVNVKILTEYKEFLENYKYDMCDTL